jgi:hypothetical protein
MQTSPDIRAYILQKVDTFQHLGMLACTSQAFRSQIYSTDKLWLDMGRKVCGEDHWSPMGNTHGRRPSARFAVMLRVCPWMAEPRRIDVTLLNNTRTLGGNVAIRSLEVVHNYCVFSAILRGGGLVRDGNHVEIMTNAYNHTSRNDMINLLPGPPPKLASLREHEVELLHMLNVTRWRPHELYPSSPIIDAVRVIHDGLFMVFCAELKRAHSLIYFVSSRTLRVLHTHRCFMRAQWMTRNVFARPGEIWIYEDQHHHSTLTYFGPIGNDQGLTTHPERGVRDAFWAACRGDAEYALDVLARNGFRLEEMYALVEDGHRLVDAVMLSQNEAALDYLLARLPAFADVFQLYKAIDKGSLALANVLVKRGVDPNDSEALYRAIRSRHCSLDMYRLLVSHGACVYPCCMLYHVRPWTDAAIVHRLLLLWSGDRCVHEENPLFVQWLLNGGDYSAPMRALAETHPWLVHQISFRGYTPLLLAAGSLCVANVRCLLDFKADPGVCDRAGHSALDWCRAASEDEPMPDWYVDAYNVLDAPAAYDYDEAGRMVNAGAIADLLQG